MFPLPSVSSEVRAAARLASGQPVWLHHGKEYYWFLGAEGALPNSLPGVGGKLYITAQRAGSLGMPTDSDLAELRLPSSADTLEALINPIKLRKSELLTDFTVTPVDVGHPAHQAMALIKQAGMLPAVIMGPAAANMPSDAMVFESTNSATPISVTRISDAKLPLHPAPNSRVVSYRDSHGATHLAIIVGHPDFANSPLVRVHSSCLTGDILGSMRCDCGDQLHTALSKMHHEKGGVVLYLDQEGRGIGLANKLRAYQLQDNGLDTYAANHALGFKDDERDFSLAAAVLRDLQIPAIRLLTNNPAKVEHLTAAGIIVTERVPLLMEANPHNAKYLAAKGTKGRHIMTPTPANISTKKSH